MYKVQEVSNKHCNIEAVLLMHSSNDNNLLSKFNFTSLQISVFNINFLLNMCKILSVCSSLQPLVLSHASRVYTLFLPLSISTLCGAFLMRCFSHWTSCTQATVNDLYVHTVFVIQFSLQDFLLNYTQLNNSSAVY